MPIREQNVTYTSYQRPDTISENGITASFAYNSAGDHPDVGLWFVPETGEAVKATVIVTNKPASLIAMIPPELAAGSYQLRIATQYSSGSNLLKAPRVNVSDKTLKVE